MTGHRKKRVVMIGCGMVSFAYMDAFIRLSERLELVAILSRHKRSAESCLSRYQHDCFTDSCHISDISQLLALEDIDFVIITTPPNARYDYASALAQASVPVLMEKPVERSGRAAKQIVDMFSTASVPLGIMLQHRARPSAAELKSKLAQGGFGALKAVEITVPWWREQSYYDVPGRGSYDRDGGGVMISQAIHTIDLALQFTGPVQAVTAMASTTSFHQMEAEDFVSAGLEFEQGCFGHLFASTASFPGRTEDIWLHYQNVSAHLLSAKIELFWQDGRQEQIGSETATGAGADPMAFSSDGHMAMIEDFMNAIETGTQPLASGRSALDVHQMIDAIEMSAQRGHRLRLSDLADSRKAH